MSILDLSLLPVGGYVLQKTVSVLPLSQMSIKVTLVPPTAFFTASIIDFFIAFNFLNILIPWTVYLIFFSTF